MRYLCRTCGTECSADSIDHIIDVNKLCPKHHKEEVANSLRRAVPRKYRAIRRRAR